MRVYIHIPFCDSKCGYCAFYSKVGDEDKHQPYMNSLLEDTIYHIEKFNINSISSVFVGGGTPNVLEAKFYIDIFEKLQPFFKKDCEITFESNPNLLTKSWLQEVKSLGLNRLSLGVQSFFEDKLKLLERSHNFAHILKSFEIANSLIDNVNIDLIYDTSLDNESRLKKELDSAINLGVTHISAYSLSIDEGSTFSYSAKYDNLKSNSNSEFVKQYLISKGLQWYEVSNFTKGQKCRHNLGYWGYDDYIGLGVSSVGKVGNKRYSTIKSIDEYINKPTFRNIEHLSSRDLIFEKIFLGFRSEVGVDINLLNKDKLNILLDEKICLQKDGRIFAASYLLADEISTWIY